VNKTQYAQNTVDKAICNTVSETVLAITSKQHMIKGF